MPSIEELAIFCKKKGFIYPSSDIYGGLSGFFDYGHLGTRLKKNFENVWRKFFLNLDENFYEIETSTIMHKNVFQASGHLDNFNDPIAIGKNGSFERADILLEKALKKKFEGTSIKELKELIKKNKIKINDQEIVDVKTFDMMFPVNLGVESNSIGYLRPETAQCPFVNFKLQFELLRNKLPMGLALIGRAYRNEISPRHFVLRQREFTQAELQIFFDPNKINEHPDFESIKNYKLNILMDKEEKVKELSATQLIKEKLPKFYIYYLVKIQQFYLDVLNIPSNKFRFRKLSDKEKAFYNKYHFDLEIELSENKFTEMGGLHYRTDHDLGGHQKLSKNNMEVLDEESKKRFIPHVLELSFGVDRNVYSLLDLNYEDDKKRGNIVLHLDKKIAPIQIAVFPLVNKVNDKAREVFELLKNDFICFYDKSGSIGRRYARQDEIGTPYCVTVDFEDGVTIRDRETTKQERISIKDLKDKLKGLFQ